MVISVPQLNSHLLIGSVNLKCLTVMSAQANMQGVDDVQDKYCLYTVVIVTSKIWLPITVHHCFVFWVHSLCFTTNLRA